MRMALRWAGYLLGGVGIAVMLGAGVMGYMGMSASYNLGDPAKFEFILIPFWQIGLGLAVVGGVCLLASGRAGRAA
jgi:hypothetical protein